MTISSITKLKFDRKAWLSGLAGCALLLSGAHHWLDFWGQPVWQQALMAIPGILLTGLLVYGFAAIAQTEIRGISRSRWLAFLIPAVGVATVAAFYVYSAPVVWHSLEIHASGPKQVRIIEIKVPGDTVRLSSLVPPAGWTLQDGALVTIAPQPAAFQYSFLGQVGQPVQVLFATSPQSGRVQVGVDGSTANADLGEAQAGSRRLQIDTNYRLGIPAALIGALIFWIDVLAFLCLLSFAWLVQEIGLAARPAVQQPGSAKYRVDLTVLLTLALVLHILNMLAVSLLVASDTPGYVQGAIYWLQYHSLDGVSPLRGPGSTFLFLPVFFFFGRNPWGMKILLHLIAIGCVPLGYRLGWQLGGRRWFAYVAGLIALLTPDLFFYSNFVMSDLPNAFLGLLFCTLLLSAFENLSWKWFLATMLVGSYAALFRSENSILLIIAAVFWVARVVSERRHYQNRQMWFRIGQGGLALGLALLPILWWSFHEYRLYDSFGLNNDGGEVLYDGWIYYGENSHVAITDQESAAVRAIAQAYRPQPGAVTRSGAPTSWDVYAYLLQAGYTSNQATEILGQAAIDSIVKDPAKTMKVLQIKIRKGFTPEMVNVPLLPLPGDTPGPAAGAPYFDREGPSSPALIQLQQTINDALARWYLSGYPVLILFSLFMLPLSLYRRPFFVWAPFVLITAERVFVPTIAGMSLWRYIVCGVVPLQILALAGIEAAIGFAIVVVRRSPGGITRPD